MDRSTVNGGSDGKPPGTGLAQALTPAALPSRLAPQAQPAGASTAAQPSVPAIMSMMGTAGMSQQQLQQLSRNFKPPPIPPHLMADVKKMLPQFEAMRAQIMSPEVAAGLRRYQAAVAALNPADPLFAQKLEQIPKPSLGGVQMPELDPAMRKKLQEWLGSQQPSAASLAAQQGQQVTGVTPQAQPWPPPPPQQQQQQQHAAQQAQLVRQAMAMQNAASKSRDVMQPARKQHSTPSQNQQQQAPQAAATRFAAGGAGKQAVVAAAPPLAPAPTPAVVAAAPLASASAPATRQRSSPPNGGTIGGGDEASSEAEAELEVGGNAPAEVEVVCNGHRGTFLVERQMMVCYCAECEARAARDGLRRNVVSPSEFERHSGTGHSKKWKYTIRTADNTQTIGAWLAANKLDGVPGRGGRFGRSPFAAKQRRIQQEAEELEASRLLALPPRRNNRKPGQGLRGASTGASGREAGWLSEDEFVEGPEDRRQQQQQQQQQQRRQGAAGLHRSSSGVPAGGLRRSASAAGVEQVDEEEEEQGEGGEGQPAQKKRRVLRWIRRASGSPEAEAAAQNGGDLTAPRNTHEAPFTRHAVKSEPPELRQQEQRRLPLLMPMQRAADAAEAAAAVAGSAVGPRMLGVPPGAAEGQLDALPAGLEPAGVRSPSGANWLQADQAMHEDHEGTDMRLGAEFQAVVPPYQGPPTAVGPAAEAREPLAALFGALESEALASAAGPEREQALSLPRDATADVWLRNVADQVRATVTGRQQRQRKQSRWLQETMDPNAVLGGKALVQRRIGGEGGAQGRFLLGRHTSAGALAASEVDAAVAAGAVPELSRWAVERFADGSLGGLEVELSLGGVTFAGTLLPSAAAAGGLLHRLGGSASLSYGALEGAVGGGGGLGGDGGGGLAAAHAAAAAAAADAGLVVATGGGGGGARVALLPAVSGIDSQQDTPGGTGALSLAATGTGGGGGGGMLHRAVFGGAASQYQPPPSSQQQLQQQQQQQQEGESRPTDAEDRRAAAEQRFQRMEVEGAPPGTICALCRGSEVDEVPEASRGLGGRSQRGLGQMLLIRVSAVAHAWLHDQCARWSPEVHDPEGDNRLEGLREAVRRGRMLRCKYCGEKGATLGCFKRTCRASYHLSCARKNQCLLQVEPYLVACPEHVDDLPAPYGKQRGANRSGSRSGRRRPKGKGRSGQRRSAGGGGAGGGGPAVDDTEDGGGEGGEEGGGEVSGGGSGGDEEMEEADAVEEGVEGAVDLSADGAAGAAGGGTLMRTSPELLQSSAEQPDSPAAQLRRRQQSQGRRQLAEAAAAGAAAAAAAAATAQSPGDASDLLAELNAFASRLEQHQQRQQQPVAAPVAASVAAPVGQATVSPAFAQHQHSTASA